jgi:hypothetical protein
MKKQYNTHFSEDGYSYLTEKKPPIRGYFHHNFDGSIQWIPDEKGSFELHQRDDGIQWSIGKEPRQRIRFTVIDNVCHLVTAPGHYARWGKYTRYNPAGETMTVIAGVIAGYDIPKPKDWNAKEYHTVTHLEVFKHRPLNWTP